MGGFINSLAEDEIEPLVRSGFMLVFLLCHVFLVVVCSKWLVFKATVNSCKDSDDEGGCDENGRICSVPKVREHLKSFILVCLPLDSNKICRKLIQWAKNDEDHV